MYFYRTIYKNKIVFTLNANFIDDIIADEIIFFMGKSRKVGLDMRNVTKIKSQKFINYLLSNKFGLFNINYEVLIYLSLVLKDGFLKSYMNVEDFNSNKRELKRRHFLIA